jgi:hypothetical protein
MTFSFRVKMNQNEIEISGTKKEVLDVIEALPKLVGQVSKALNPAEAMTDASESKPVVVRLTSPAAASPKMFPSIKEAKNCSGAVVKLLMTEWGTWKPRKTPEIIEALKANALHYPRSTLSGVLAWLVKKGKVRRWKTDAGYVYILAEKEAA